MIAWRRVTETMLESDDRVFQISRTPVPVGGSHIYRLWRRVTNDVLLALTALDEPESRAQAVASCKEKAEDLADGD